MKWDPSGVQWDHREVQRSALRIQLQSYMGILPLSGIRIHRWKGGMGNSAISAISAISAAAVGWVRKTTQTTIEEKI